MSVPIERLIFAFQNTSCNIAIQKSTTTLSIDNSVAKILIRNCRIPKTDIQLGLDRTLGFDTKNHSSRGANNRTGSSTTSKRNGRGGIINRKGVIKDLEKTAQRENSFRTWNRPAYEDFLCSLYCDRLMLGEPPLRTALVVPLSVEDTFDSFCRLLQQYQTLQPEDILMVFGDDHDHEISEENHSSPSSPPLFLGPVSECLSTVLARNTLFSEEQKTSFQLALQAIQWRFSLEQQQKQDEDDDDDDPLQYVTCLFGGRQIVAQQQQQELENVQLDQEFKALLAALWCSHPEEAARAANMFYRSSSQQIGGESSSAFLDSVLVRETHQQQQYYHYSDDDDDEEKDKEEEEIMRVAPLFQFSMLKMKDEKILEAANEPSLLRAVVPGLAPTTVTTRSESSKARVEQKQKSDELKREEGKTVLKKLMRF
jgi:hypothetical protein